MNAKIFKTISDVRSSYYFVPACLVVAAVLLALLMLWIDNRLPADYLDGIAWLRFVQADAARSVVATIAGSMITVAGVASSMTLVAVSHASTQFGPRLLSNFMRDRGNQFALGIFVATFVYCMLVLRAIHAPGEGDGSTTAAFIPNLSVTFAIVLAIVNVFALVYYIDHVAENIRLSTITARVGRELQETLPKRFPSDIGRDARSFIHTPEQMTSQKRQLETNAVELPCDVSGFVQRITSDRLIECCSDNDVVVELLKRPGEFVAAGEVLFRIAPAHLASEDLTQRLRRCVAMGDDRTSDQNSLFLMEQLVEVAARALSPGVNDPRTAMDCLQWLRNSMFQLVHHLDPSAERLAEDGQLRVLAPVASYETMVDVVFDQLRPYFAADANASRDFLHAIDWLLDRETSAARRDHLRGARQRFEAEMEHAGLSGGTRQRLGKASPSRSQSLTAELDSGESPSRSAERSG